MADYFNPSAMMPKGDSNMWSPGPMLSRELFDTNRADYNKLMDVYKQSQDTQLSKDQLSLQYTQGTQPGAMDATNAENLAKTTTVGDLKRGEALSAISAGETAQATQAGRVASTNSTSALAVQGNQGKAIQQSVQNLSLLSDALGSSGVAGTPAEFSVAQQMVKNNPTLAADPLVKHLMEVGPAPGKSFSDTLQLMGAHAHAANPETLMKREEIAGREKVADKQATAHVTGSGLAAQASRDVANINASWHNAQIQMLKDKEAVIKKADMIIADLIRKRSEGRLLPAQEVELRDLQAWNLTQKQAMGAAQQNYMSDLTGGQTPRAPQVQVPPGGPAAGAGGIPAFASEAAATAAGVKGEVIIAGRRARID